MSAIDLNSFPKKPGVYIMKDAEGKVLYVGKAKHLQKRLKQYFVPQRDTRAQIPLLVAKIADIENYCCDLRERSFAFRTLSY